MINARLAGALLLLPVLAVAQGGPPGARQVTVESMVVAPERLEERLEFNLETIMRLVCVTPSA